MSIGNKIRDGFPGEKLINIPIRVLKEAREKKPALFRMYITQIGYFPSAANHYRQRRHGCQDNILIYCVAGTGHCIIDNKRFEVNENEFIIIPATKKYICYWSDPVKPWTIYWIHFTGTDILPFNKAMNITLTKGAMPIAFNDAGIAIWNKIFSTLSISFKIENLCNANFCLQYLISTFLFPYWHMQESAQSEKGAMDRAVEIMKSNVNTKMSVPEIAEKVNLSYSYFCMLFKKTFGTPPMDHFISLKIEKACQLLRNENYKIKDVSYELGYDDQYYFSRVFKKVVGVSPEKFRKNHDNVNEFAVVDT